MTLSDSIKADVGTIFTNTDDFGESIVYHFGAGGSRTINAVVEREPVAFYEGDKIVIPTFTIDIHNNATTGVLDSNIDTGGDQVAIKLRTNDSVTVKKTVLKILGSDEGWIQLAVA